jgi:hypothetical protein
VATIASRSEEFIDFLTRTDGITPIYKDEKLVEFEVDVNKVTYPK